MFIVVTTQTILLLPHGFRWLPLFLSPLSRTRSLKIGFTFMHLPAEEKSSSLFFLIRSESYLMMLNSKLKFLGLVGYFCISFNLRLWNTRKKSNEMNKRTNESSMEQKKYELNKEKKWRSNRKKILASCWKTKQIVHEVKKKPKLKKEKKWETWKYIKSSTYIHKLTLLRARTHTHGGTNIYTYKCTSFSCGCIVKERRRTRAQTQRKPLVTFFCCCSNRLFIVFHVLVYL